MRESNIDPSLTDEELGIDGLDRDLLSEIHRETEEYDPMPLIEDGSQVELDDLDLVEDEDNIGFAGGRHCIG